MSGIKHQSKNEMGSGIVAKIDRITSYRRRNTWAGADYWPGAGTEEEIVTRTGAAFKSTVGAMPKRLEMRAAYSYRILFPEWD